jgi:hypothetical protein
MPNWLIKVASSKWYSLGWIVIYGCLMVWNIVRENWIMTAILGLGVVSFGLLFWKIVKIKKHSKDN